MATIGMPRTKRNEVAPLSVTRLSRTPLVRAAAFLMMAEDRETKERYPQAKLALYWDSGYPQRDADGELITDDEGRARPHLIVDGYVTVSGHHKANFVKLVRAMGFVDKRFYEQSGPNKGSLTREVQNSLLVEFGKNRLGDDYSGATWDDLPFYELRSRGGQHAKSEVEVEVKSLKLAGYELLGRVVDMAITIDDNGYNRIESYLLPEGFTSLDTPLEPVASMSLGGPSPSAVRSATAAKERTPARDQLTREEVETAAVFGDSIDPYNEDTPFDDAPTTKRAIYVTRSLKAAGIPGKDRIAFLQFLLEDDTVTSIANIERDPALQFKALVEGPEAIDDPVLWLRRRFNEFNARRDHPHLYDKADGDGEDEDADF